jgi:hypothetical protein
LQVALHLPDALLQIADIVMQRCYEAQHFEQDHWQAATVFKQLGGSLGLPFNILPQVVNFCQVDGRIAVTSRPSSTTWR